MERSELLQILKNIHEEMIDKEDFQATINSLNKIKINGIVKYYLEISEWADNMDFDIVEWVIKILQGVYNNSSDNSISPITDEDYDNLYAVFVSKTGKNIVGSENVKNRKTIFHNYPDLRGTLDKVHWITNEEKGKDKKPSIENWISSCENRMGRKFDNSPTILFPKWDGVSVIFECKANGEIKNAMGRGDVGNNEAVDITKLFKGLKFDSYDTNGSEFGVKTEVVMTYNDFQKLSKKEVFKNPRSAVSSIINSKDINPKYLKYLTIIPLRVQIYDTKDIFIHPSALTTFPVCHSYIKDYKKYPKYMEKLKNDVYEEFGIPIDGIVVYVDDINIQKSLGRIDHINKYEFAFKFPPEKKLTKLIDIDFSAGVLGSITPVARVEPVVIKGNTISNISLGSMDRFESLYLRKGDEVYIKYDVIPYLTKEDTCKSGNGPFIEPPTHCSHCGDELVKNPVLCCDNRLCPTRVIGKIVNYLDKMRIPNLSIGIVTTLFNNGIIKSIEDLYLLENHKKRILKIPGFGEKSFEKMIKSINYRRAVTDYELLGSLGIPSIGRKIFKKILDIYYIDELMEICSNEDIRKLTDIKGIDTITAEKIIGGILINEALIEFLKNELDIRRERTDQYRMKVAFTKVRDKNFEKHLKQQKIYVSDNYSKDVDILIIKDNFVSSKKIEKAQKDNKRIMTLQEAYRYFKYKISPEL